MFPGRAIFLPVEREGQAEMCVRTYVSSVYLRLRVGPKSKQCCLLKKQSNILMSISFYQTITHLFSLYSSRVLLDV
jgi:hypothetical protein